jgi:hypothetical protein
MGGLPKTGYRFERRSSCRGCGKTIEWFTSPAGRWMLEAFGADLSTVIVSTNLKLNMCGIPH